VRRGTNSIKLFLLAEETVKMKCCLLLVSFSDYSGIFE
jgi:hypothetical protein